MLIGSRAAKIHFPDFYREPKDWDHITQGEVAGEDNHICPVFEEILENATNDVASPELLYTLKLSHCFWPLDSWQKTMSDIVFFQRKGVKHNEELFKKLYAQWEVIHGAKRAKLNKTNEEFFADNVNRRYVHDDIHAAVAYYERPLYFSIKKDENSAQTSKELFDNLSEDDKMKLVREEVYVTALERFLIPQDFKCSKAGSYNQAIKLLMVSMTKGYFPKYIALNWDKLKQRDDHDFVGKFQQALNESKIRKIE